MSSVLASELCKGNHVAASTNQLIFGLPARTIASSRHHLAQKPSPSSPEALVKDVRLIPWAIDRKVEEGEETSHGKLSC